MLPTTHWQGLTGDVDLLVLHTRDEQRLLSSLSGELGQPTREQADAAAEALRPDPVRYRACFPDPEQLNEVVRLDWLFRMPSLALAEAQLRAGATPHALTPTDDQATTLRGRCPAGSATGGPFRGTPSTTVRPRRAASGRLVRSDRSALLSDHD